MTAQDMANGVRVYIAGNPPFVWGAAEQEHQTKTAMMIAWGDEYGMLWIS